MGVSSCHIRRHLQPLTRALLLMAGCHLIAGSIPPLCNADEPVADVQGALNHAATLLASGQFQQALDALETVETEEPDNPWLWIYRARIHDGMGQLNRALGDYDHAVRSLNQYDDPESIQLATDIRRDRRKVRRRLFGFSLSTGLAYDTNVSFLGGGTTGIDLIANAPDGRFRTHASAYVRPHVTDDEWVTVGMRADNDWYFRIEEFDFQDYGGFIEYVRRLGDHWQFGLRYDYDISYLERDSFLSSHALSPRLSYFWSRESDRLWLDRTDLVYRIEAHDFLFETTPEFDRDGFVNAVGIAQSLKLRPIADLNWTWDLSAGYMFESVATEGTEFDRLNHNYFVSASVPLIDPRHPEKYLILPDKELRFDFLANWQAAYYREQSEIDRRHHHRKDLLTTLNFALSQTLIDDPDTGELILRAIVNWTNANSSIRTARDVAPFTYDKVVWGLQVEWSF